MSKPISPDSTANLNRRLLSFAIRSENRQRELFREAHARLLVAHDPEADALAIAVASLADEYARSA